MGATAICKFTGEKIEITESFLEGIERNLLDAKTDKEKRLSFRKDTQKIYASRTLTQEIMLEARPLAETELYGEMHERYVHNLKERVLEPFQENENFRRAIKDYGEENFKAYDKGAKEVCMYIIDNDLAKKFANP